MLRLPPGITYFISRVLFCYYFVMSASRHRFRFAGALFLWAGVISCQSKQQAPDFPFPENPSISDAAGHPRDTLTDYFHLPDYISKQPHVEAGVARQIQDDFRHLSSELYYFGAPVLSNYPLPKPIFRALRHSASDPVQLFTFQVDEKGPFLLVQALNHHSNLGGPQAPPPVLSSNEQAERKWLQRPPTVEYTCRYDLSKSQWYNMTSQFPETYSPYYISPSVFEGFGGNRWLFETSTPRSYSLYYYRADSPSYLIRWLEAHGYPEQ
ncbi:hypothetical protein PK28_13395 [Hymenobacter sp. DG25B]|nr:hypothetical protein PK28_13395 [Hymenobacter sp. DG25B]